MTLIQFISQYDYEGSVVLIEGKRNVPTSDQNKLETIGRLLAEKTKHITFRSGNANGADLYFSKGVVSVDFHRLEVMTPYDEHRKKSNLAGKTLSLESIDITAYDDIVNLSALNKKTQNLLKRYVDGHRDRFTQKVAFIIRDTIKVVGVEGFPQASFGIFYDDLSDPKSGGTGHTMLVCDHCQVPYIDQTIWFHWLRDSIM